VLKFFDIKLMKKDKILIIGAGGQIGAVLTETLRDIYGDKYVIATDIRDLGEQSGPTEVLNALDASDLERIVKKWKINQIYHLAAI
jgi:threonine 3-dehydrogenase